MKTLLLTACLAVAAVSGAQAETRIDRSGWTVTGCSHAYPNEGSTGLLADMFDDNIDTYWHQNWAAANETQNEPYHWFMIDMGRTQTVSGFDYWRRKNSTNGQFISGKVYVSDTPFAAFESHAAENDPAKAFADNPDNVPAGTFNFTYTDYPNLKRSARFDAAVEGRYVLVVLTDAGADGAGRHACCSEFQLVTPKESYRKSLDRSNWQVSACSQINDSNFGGPLGMLFDNDPYSYYHSDYNRDVPADEGSVAHWIKIDMQQSKDFDGFSYIPRLDSTNGCFFNGKVYVSDSPFDAVTDDATALAYVGDDANVANGVFDFSATPADNKTPRIFEFDETQNGRYVMFIITKAAGNFCCGAELELFAYDKASFERQWTEGIADALAKAEKYTVMASALGIAAVDTTYPTNLTADTYQAAIDAKVAELNEFVNAFDGKKILIQCGIRRSGAYLTAIPTGTGVKLNTTSAGPDAVWQIKNTADGFRLYSRTTGYYIGTNQAPQTEGSAQTYTARTINGAYVAFAKDGGESLLNVDTSSNDLTAWSSATDEGSSWNIVLADAENSNYAGQLYADTYYRLINARWMENASSPNLAVNGENRNQTGIGEATSRSTASIPGAYWKFVIADGGKVYIENLCGYRLSLPAEGQSNSNAIVNKEGSQLSILKLTDEGYDNYNVFAISTSDPMTDSSCLDATTTGASVFCWNPNTEGRYNGDNGSAWYLILASDDEVNAATASYINAVKARSTLIDPELAEVMGAEAYGELCEKYPLLSAEITDPKAANEAKLASTDEAKNDIAAAVTAAANENLAGKQVVIRSLRAGNPYYMAINEATGAMTAETAHINTVWNLTATDDGFIITNDADGKSLTYVTENNASIPLAEQGSPYQISYRNEYRGFLIGLNETAAGCTTRTGYNYLHQNDGSRLLSWEPGQGSAWMFEPVVAVEPVFAQGGNNHTITMPAGTTLNVHSSALDLTMTITRIEDPAQARRRVAAVDGVHTLTPLDFTDDSAVLEGLEAGNYEVKAPAGMFLTNGKPTSINTSFTVTENGGVVSINEISAKADDDVIYDLQGRRAGKPLRGLYIVNGKKIYLK